MKKSEKPPKSSENVGLLAENLFRQVFGDQKYYGYASAFNDATFLKKELLKLVNRFEKHVSELKASEKFLNFLQYQLGYLKIEINRSTLNGEMAGLLIVNLKIIATFLGYHYASGNKREEPYFIPSIWAEKQAWIESRKFYQEEDKLIEVRKQVVTQLLRSGHTLAEVSFILNISGYKLAQIKQQIDSKN